MAVSTLEAGPFATSGEAASTWVVASTSGPSSAIASALLAAEAYSRTN